MVNSICNEMYSKLPNLVLGFHGCHKDVFDSVVKGGQHLKRSENEYDWLGNGIYFGKTVRNVRWTGQNQDIKMKLVW